MPTHDAQAVILAAKKAKKTKKSKFTNCSQKVHTKSEKSGRKWLLSLFFVTLL
jgi:hypothetical protein